MKQITTQDGSITFKSERYGETYHSVTGAIEEAQKKFVEPCYVKPGFKVLDICFGLGYNTAAALHVSQDIEVIGLENDPAIVEQIRAVPAPLQEYAILAELKGNGDCYVSTNKKIRILIGDARKTIKQIPKQWADCCFLDPFSPKACPELWTQEFFEDIRSCMKPGGVLTTYSCARAARDNLKKAGFVVEDGPRVGRRGPSSTARNPLQDNPLHC